MPAVIPIAAAVVGGGIAAHASRSAASMQADSAKSAQDSQRQMYEQTRQDQAPWRQAGATALGQLSDGTAPGGQFTHNFGPQDLKNGLSPNYDFQLQQGLGAVNNQNSVTGGLVGGNALKGINDYAQGSASSAYQNAFNNYNVNQSNIFNRLSSIAGLGQTAVGQTTTAGLGYAGNIGSAQLAGGAAQAAGIMGQGNAISGAVNNAAGWYLGSQGSQGPLNGPIANWGRSGIPQSSINTANNSSDPIQSLYNTQNWDK